MSRSIDVSVRVDLDDILADLSEEDLRKEIQKRREMDRSLYGEESDEAFIDDLKRAACLLRDGDATEALLIMERVLWPKWSTPDEAVKSYREAVLS